MKSLKVHSRFAIENAVPEPLHLKDQVMHCMEEAYHVARISLPEDFCTYNHFIRVLSRLDNTSTPGYPFSMCASTIGDWLGFDGFWYNEFKVNELWHYVVCLMDDPTDLVLTVFIKDEPHKRAKVLADRWRLIMGFPLHYQVLWHMLFGEQNDKLLEKSLGIPSQQGISTYHGGWKHYVKVWNSRSYDVSLDKSAWDWTVNWWLLRWELEVRGRLISPGASKQRWHELSLICYERAFCDPILLLSDGNMYRQCVPGVMKSGCVNTISSNSFMQVILHCLVNFSEGLPLYPLPVAVGDDVRQSSTNLAKATAYLKFGAIVKEVIYGKEFVGMNFLDTGPVPLYTPKHLFKAMSMKNETMDDRELLSQYLDSMLRLYAYSDDFNLWLYIAAGFGCLDCVYSQEYYRRCFDVWVE